MCPRKERDEVSFYPEITKYFEDIINANFQSMNSSIRIHFKYGMDLAKGIREFISELGIEGCLKTRLLSRSPALKLDIFGLLYDGASFAELLILEVKLLEKVGLNQYSQLLGYCLSSDAEYGILINVNGFISSPLTECLSTNDRLSLIVRDKISGGQTRHILGLMTWDSESNNLIYSKLGRIQNIEQFCELVELDCAKYQLTQMVEHN